MGDTQPPLEYLVACSQTSGESFLISRSTSLTELRRRVRRVLGAWVQTDAEERLARQFLALEQALEPQPAFPVPRLPRHASLSRPTAISRRHCGKRSCGWRLAFAANPSEPRPFLLIPSMDFPSQGGRLSHLPRVDLTQP